MSLNYPVGNKSYHKMVFSSEMTQKLVNLVFENWLLINTGNSKTNESITKNRQGWKNITDSLNAQYPEANFTMAQIKDKWQKVKSAEKPTNKKLLFF